MPQYGFDPRIVGQARRDKATVNALNQQTDFIAEDQEAKRQQTMAAQQQAQLMNQLDLSQPYETQTEIISQLPQETQQGLLKFYQETPEDLRSRKQAIKTATQDFIKNTYGSVKDQASYDRMRTQLPMFLHGSGAKPEEIREVLQMVPREYDKDRVLMEWAAVGGPQNALDGSYTLSQGQKRIGAQGNVLAEVAPKETTGTSPYSKPIKTSQGWMGYDTRTNTAKPIQYDEEATAMPISADVDLVGRKESTKKEVDRVAKLKSSYPKAKASLKAFERGADNVIETIDESIGMVGLNTAGPGAILARVNGTEARALQENIKTIIANKAFGFLAEMRQNSPTGGAVGQLSERELELMGLVEASLNQGQDPEQLRANLEKIKRLTLEMKESSRQAFEEDFQEVAGESKTNGATGGWSIKRLD